MMRDRGFTLVEMLVVGGILAVLAGILLPVFGSARRSAGERSDLMRLKQLATAVHLYASDYEDAMVPGADDATFIEGVPAGYTASATFADLTSPYVRDPAVYRQSRRPARITLPPKHRGSDFLYDQVAGLKRMRESEVPRERSLVFPAVPEGEDPRTFPVPCLRYDLAAPRTIFNVCDSRITWWYD